jgi:hypothetical protein
MTTTGVTMNSTTGYTAMNAKAAQTVNGALVSPGTAVIARPRG